MTIKRNLTVIAVAFGIVALMLPLRAQKKAEWKTFSNQEFEIRYPEAWSLDEGEKEFAITSAAAAVRGKSTDAEIRVQKRSADASTLDEAVGWDNGAGRLLQKTELRGPALIQSHCGRLYKAVRRAAAGAKSGEIHTSYYCVKSKGTFELTLSNAQGDPRHRALQQTALEILSTLKAQ
jgi:hypothetical protein